MPARALHEKKVTLRPYPSRDFVFPLQLISAGYEFWPLRRTLAFEHSKLFVIEYVTGGEAEYVQDSERTAVRAGEAYCFHKGSDHLYNTGDTGFLSTRFVSVDGPMLDILLQSMGLSSIHHIPIPSGLGPLMKRAYGLLATSAGPESVAMCSTLAYEILLCLSLAVRPRHHGTVERCLEYMTRNLHRKMDIAALCAEVGVSHTHLCRLFRRELGCSPAEYFISRKLTWTCSMLTHTDLSIKEISALAGYDNQLYFSSQFKKRLGVAPKVYRASPEKVRPR